jgi:hypothetical protein
LNWIAQVPRKDWGEKCPVALGWSPKEKALKTTWQRMVEVERNRVGWMTWNSARHGAADRHQWKMEEK